MHILSPSKQQSRLPQSLTDDWTTRVAGTHEDAPASIHSPAPSTNGLLPMTETRGEALKVILSAACTVPGSSEPLVPNRPQRHAPPRSSTRPPSAPSSHRASLASTAVQTTDDGYTTDATMSTLPPSYRTHRSHPDLPSYPSMPARPPLPVASPSYAEPVTAPPSAYVQLGRPRRNHPRPPAPTDCPSYDILLGERQTSTTFHSLGVSGPTQSMGEQLRAYPRKSLDGGIRLAGGRLDEL